MGGHFPAVESFVVTHRSCEAMFKVTLEQADLDFVFSGLLASPN
jgi:hypothetical protein